MVGLPHAIAEIYTNVFVTRQWPAIQLILILAVMIAVFAVTAVLLHLTRFGQHLFAIGGNREAARFAGIAIARHEVAVYALCGLCAGLAGMIHASQLYSAEPAAGQGFELNAIAAVVVGGEDKAVEAGRPILLAMGKNVVHTGGSGSGQAAKICNNMILGVSMIAVSEAFVLAEKLGLDHQKLFDISSKSSGQCWSMTSYCPVPGPVPTSPANRDYRPGFTAAMMGPALCFPRWFRGCASPATCCAKSPTC